MAERTTGKATVTGVADIIDVLSRRGALELFTVLTGAPRSRRALLGLHGSIAESVWAQRLADLRAADVVEEVRETGELRLSPRGRRLQGVLDQLDHWAQS